MNQSKVITPAEACEIGRKYREEMIEWKFIRYVMEYIVSAAKHNNSVEFEDKRQRAVVLPNQTIDFLTAHPEQITRLENMGYKVQQDTKWVTATWNEDEIVSVPKGPFGLYKISETRSVIKQTTIQIRQLKISWCCEE
jgi:hypothetical protein